MPEDVILEVNRTPVTNVSQVKRELERAAAGSTVFLVVWRVGAGRSTGNVPDAEEKIGQSAVGSRESRVTVGSVTVDSRSRQSPVGSPRQSSR